MESVKSVSDVENEIVPKAESKKDNPASDYDPGTTVSSNATKKPLPPKKGDLAATSRIINRP